MVQEGAEALLIDTGPDPNVLGEQLRKRGVTRVDTLVLTHDHDDHIGGASALVGPRAPSTIVVAQGAEDSARIKQLARSFDADVRSVRAGDSLLWREIVLDVWGPLTEVYDAGANESCLIMRISDQGSTKSSEVPLARWLFTRAHIEASSILVGGDAETLSVKRAVELHDLAREPVDILKLGHHGSANSVDASLLDHVQPNGIVVSVGAQNDYGHPSPRALELCRRYTSRILRTDRDGAIILRLRPAVVAQ